MSDDTSKSFFGQMPEMPWKELRRLAYEIHARRLGTKDTRDDCVSCWNMARRKLGMEPVPEPEIGRPRRTASGLYLPESHEG